jgi:hypothetical protein
MLGRFARSSLTSAFAAVRAPASASAFGPSQLQLQMQAKRRLTGLVVGVPKESLDGELRVALAPESVKKLKKAGVTVKIQVRGHMPLSLSLSGPLW